ncbi:hypothetical protein Golomagni_00555 [Golovinomyces magnicellulatus]|nr:hypothetical protein Golomagni_00555 [Golovinomyces magnicellulatus]
MIVRIAASPNHIFRIASWISQGRKTKQNKTKSINKSSVTNRTFEIFSLMNSNDSTSELPSKSSSTLRPQWTLQAVYATPCDSAFTYTKTIPLATNPTLEETNKYLSTLKLAVGDLQEKINVELTRRMEEDSVKLALIEPEIDVVIPAGEDAALE